MQLPIQNENHISKENNDVPMHTFMKFLLIMIKLSISKLLLSILKIFTIELNFNLIGSVPG